MPKGVYERKPRTDQTDAEGLLCEECFPAGWNGQDAASCQHGQWWHDESKRPWVVQEDVAPSLHQIAETIASLSDAELAEVQQIAIQLKTVTLPEFGTVDDTDPSLQE